ncbi:DUF2057 domain-containing protein [Shewanella sp. Isolate11]|uniref:YccT family protein n=1 Tax=Shewanella sp. Isolate11 TaxID=2908530 RepID=UPI001EFD97EE|nr:DUF2057 domain-containing protein [Shewanella sp. Isolate11]MCG9696351.1 DUF2057 domain-containing protein [Shewanella sp. Isolate11]
MKIILLILISSPLLFISSASAAVNIHLPSETEPLLLNGKTIDQRQLQTENGQQQLVFKYLESYRQFGSQRRFTSEAIILTFSAKDDHYQIKLPEINSAKEAERFNNKPMVEIIDSKGVNLDYQIDTLRKQGMQVGRNYPLEIKQYNSQGKVAAISQPQSSTMTSTHHTEIKSTSINNTTVDNQPKPQASTTTTASTAAIIAATDANNTPLSEDVSNNRSQYDIGKMLDFWYQQADEQTRKAFKERIGVDK